MKFSGIIITVVLLFCIASISQVHAFEPAPGNRAYPITGRDIVNGGMVSLDDYLGKWVLLDYWATW